MRFFLSVFILIFMMAFPVIAEERETENEMSFRHDFGLIEEYAVEQASEADHFYYFNYMMYLVNDIFYFYAFKPIIQGYTALTPPAVRVGLSNFFHNLMFPMRFVNNILQGKFDRGLNEIGIFAVNSTVGLLGFMQVAQKYMNKQTNDEDLGQTLGVYGIGNGFYIFLPFLGPLTLRDALGTVGDYFINPVSYIEPWELRCGTQGLYVFNSTSFKIGTYEVIKEASLDPYEAIRNAYVQDRKNKVAQ